MKLVMEWLLKVVLILINLTKKMEVNDASKIHKEFPTILIFNFFKSFIRSRKIFNIYKILIKIKYRAIISNLILLKTSNIKNVHNLGYICGIRKLDSP